MTHAVSLRARREAPTAAESAESLADGGPARIHPFAFERGHPRRAADDPPLRADAARRDPALRLADDRPLEAGRAATPISSSASPSGGSPSASIGARAYHDITSWNEVPTPKWQGIFEVWKGGLGDLGRDPARDDRRGDRRAPRRASAAPPSWTRSRRASCSPRGSAGSATGGTRSSTASRRRLPWGLKIDAAHQRGLAAKYLNAKAYQPTFLYELIWDLAGVALLLWLDKRYTFRPPALFALYVAYYCFGRFFEELLRIDPSHHFLGLRHQRLGLDRPLRRRDRVLRLVAGARARRLRPRRAAARGEAAAAARSRSGRRWPSRKGRVR